MTIPPGMPNYEIAAFRMIPPGFLENDDSEIFATILHGHHRIAVTVFMTVVPANETEAILASCNANYDFDLQELVFLEKSIKIHTGDLIIAHCAYDSSARTEVTFGSDSTS